MENNHIIIILLVIIIVLVCAIGVMILNPANAQEPVKIKITSDSEQYEDGELSVKLTDSNGTALSDEIVNITITKNGKAVVDDIVKTNSKGNGKLDLDLKKGEYVVNATFAGNENYTANSTSQKLKVTKEAKTTTVSSTSTSSSSDTPYDINNLPPSNDPYPETNRYFIDDYIVKQEYADGYMRTVDIRTGEIHSLGF